MKINLSLRYWLGHKKRAGIIIITIAACMAALTCAAFLARSSSVTLYENQLDLGGYYDVIIPDISEDKLAEFESDSRFSDTGILFRGGSIYSSGGREFLFGALSEGGERLYHLSTIEGGYPEKSGEITAYRSFFEANGYAAFVGNNVRFELFDFDGNSLGTREFVISGVIDDTNARTFWIFPEHKFPNAFLHISDIPQNSGRDFLGNYAIGTDVMAMQSEFRQNGVSFYIGTRIMMMVWMAQAPITEISEESLRNNISNAQKDFYALALIPIFSGIILIVAFTSILSVVSTSLIERRKQFSMLRSIGMSKMSVLKMSLCEAFFMALVGIILGFLLGVLFYIISIEVQNNLLGMNIYYAFNVDFVIEAITINPYVVPAVESFICALCAVLIPYLAELRKSPVEGLSENKKLLQERRFSKERKLFVLSKISGNMAQSAASILIITLIMWSGIFGFTYFSEQAKVDSKNYTEMIEQSELSGFDYFAAKDFYGYSISNSQFNRHGSGMEKTLAGEVSELNEVDFSLGIIESPGTKAVYTSENITDAIHSALGSVNIENFVQDGLEELYSKSREMKGYKPEELIFNIPTVGVPEELFETLSEYLTSGSVSLEALNSGEEVLILNTTGSSPYSVGDIINMSDVVIEDELHENFDFSSGNVPQGEEPHFYYYYTDGVSPYPRAGYSYGSRRDYRVRVAGILDITDGDLLKFISTKGAVNANGQRVDCGFNILCADSAFENWGLPDRNYTKFGVKLKNNGNASEFEKSWFNLIGNSEGVESTSLAELYRAISNSRNKNMTIFAAMIISVIILGFVGIINSASLQIRRGLRSYSILRALGLTKASLSLLILRQRLAFALIGAVTAFIPLGVFEFFRRLALEKKGTLSSLSPEDGKFNIPWHWIFPWRLELFSQPLYLIIPAVLILVAAVILISNMIPARWIAKKNITEALRNDDF
ncbi:MAG: ABC transporter permease [Oscillospiraceae bacterium]|nr:ABC transporter permease [Oscillospiraceae bacterium]